MNHLFHHGTASDVQADTGRWTLDTLHTCSTDSCEALHILHHAMFRSILECSDGISPMFAPISCAIKQIYDSSLHPGSVSRPCVLLVIAPVPGGHSIDVITIDSMVSIHEVYSHSYKKLLKMVLWFCTHLSSFVKSTFVWGFIVLTSSIHSRTTRRFRTSA